ncbi:AMP-binding protein [Nocardioides sp. zg-DK7169]|uniref:AMP-binding protein n=1 Tax=Nocardioides sp. zg-DK7169 TaxID=2736600 RepID=UPI003464D8D3
MSYNLSTLLEDSAAKYPDRDAVVLGETRLTYASINAFANMCANMLVERGIGPGDKVALSCPNLPYFTIVYFGILKAGATVVPLNVLLKGREIAYHLEDSTRRPTSASRAPPSCRWASTATPASRRSTPASTSSSSPPSSAAPRRSRAPRRWRRR